MVEMTYSQFVVLKCLDFVLKMFGFCTENVWILQFWATARVQTEQLRGR